MELREKSLKVLSLMRRKGVSLTEASGENGISPVAVINNTNALKKEGNVWKVKKYDLISRVMRINEDGVEVFVHIRDSRHRSAVGRYQDAVKKFLHNGDASILEPFEGKSIKDAMGEWHLLDTDPDSLYEDLRGESGGGVP